MDRTIDKFQYIVYEVRRRLEALGRDEKITGPKRGIIQKIGDSKEPILEKDVSTCFNLRKSSVSELISSLENDGIIERVRSENDARCKHLVLTNKGLEAYKDGLNHLNEVQNDVVQTLTEEEQIELNSLLDKIIISL